MTDKITIIFLLFLTFTFGYTSNASPKIAVSGKDTVDVGTYPANRMVNAKFIIKNKGDADLIIKRIRKTCGCSTTRLAKKILKPGEETELTVSIIKNSIRGSFTKSVYIENNTPDQRFLRLSMVGKAVALLKILPQKNLYMGTLEIGKTYDFPFRLITSQSQIKIKIEILKNNFPLKTDVRKSIKGFDLNLKASPDSVNDALEATVMISILSPSGWPPMMINLKGKAIKQQPAAGMQAAGVTK